MTNKNSPAKLKANNNYNKRTYKSFHLRLKPYQMEIFSSYCERFNYSKNQFLINAMIEKIEKETGKNFDDLMSEMRTADEVGSAETAEDPGAKVGRE